MSGPSMRKAIFVLIVLLPLAAFGQYISYWFQGWQRQGNARDAQEYFMVPGAGVTFTYATTNRVIINANGVATSTNAIYSQFATNWYGSNSMQVQITTVSNQVVTTSNILQNQIIVSSNADWHIAGNTLGAGTFFLGSIDNRQLQFRVNNSQVGLFSTLPSVALGDGCTASAVGSAAIGRNSSATSSSDVAIGDTAAASGGSSLALGSGSVASGVSSLAMLGTAQNAQSIALGSGSLTAGDRSVAIGFNTQPQADDSFALGSGSYTTGPFAFALGRDCGANNQGSFVWSDSTSASYGDTVANQFVVYASGGIDLHSAGAGIVTDAFITSGGKVTATNFVTSAVKWIDIPMNYNFSIAGLTAPSLVPVTNSPPNSSAIQALGFDNTDELFAIAQLPHSVAITNASFPSFYFEPHVHFDTIGTLNSTHSNVTWRIEWQVAAINGVWYSGTNSATMGVTNNFRHYMIELGHITNNAPLGISAVFRCRLMRPASAAQDYSNSHDVILDGFDLHVPVGNQNAIGSSSDNAP